MPGARAIKLIVIPGIAYLTLHLAKNLDVTVGRKFKLLNLLVMVTCVVALDTSILLVMVASCRGALHILIPYLILLVDIAGMLLFMNTPACVALDIVQPSGALRLFDESNGPLREVPRWRGLINEIA